MRRRQRETGRNVNALRAAALLCAGLPLAGCGGPLALQDPFFNPFNTTTARIEEQVSSTVAEGRTRQALVQGCIGMPRQGCPPKAAVPPRPDQRALRALEAWESGALPKHPAGDHAGAL